MLIFSALKFVYGSSKKYLVITALISLLSLYLYYLAIEHSASWYIFLNANSREYIIAQIVFSIINSVLIGISLSMFFFSFEKKTSGGKLNIFQTGASLFFSVATTGCYVCGSILLPTAGLTASFLSLPFGGLEIKFLTILLLLHSINQYAKNISGACEIKKYKDVNVNLGAANFKFSTKIFDTTKSFAFTFGFIAIIFALPTITSMLGYSKFVGASQSYSCNINASK